MRFVTATLVGWCVIGLQLVSIAGQTSPTGNPLNIGTEWRVRYEDRDCTSFCSMNQKDVQDELSRLRVNLSTRFGQNSQVFARFQYSYRRNHQSGSAGTHEKSGFQQLYVDRKWDKVSLRLGRQELGYGDYRLLLLTNWDNIGYTWDAIRLGIKGSSWQADVLYGRPGMFPTSTTHPVLYGVYANVKPDSRWQSDLYLLRKEVIASGSQHRIWAMGARPSVRLSPNTRLTAEMTLQSGKVGSKSLKAWGYWLRLEHDIPRLRNTKMVFQYDFASGGNPDDSTLHTLDQFFGTTFAICGRMGLQGWRNMNSWRIGVSGVPSPRWSYTADVHINRLADARDYWYSGSGAPVRGVNGAPLRDPTGSAGTDVGTELNFTVNYALSNSLQISVGYGRFHPGGFVRATNSGFADRTEWFYLQTTSKF